MTCPNGNQNLVASEVLNETDIFNGSCGSFMPRGYLGCEYPQLGAVFYCHVTSSKRGVTACTKVQTQMSFIMSMSYYTLYCICTDRTHSISIKNHQQFQKRPAGQESQWLLPTAAMCQTQHLGLLYLPGRWSRSRCFGLLNLRFLSWFHWFPEIQVPVFTQTTSMTSTMTTMAMPKFGSAILRCSSARWIMR